MRRDMCNRRREWKRSRSDLLLSGNENWNQKAHFLANSHQILWNKPNPSYVEQVDSGHMTCQCVDGEARLLPPSHPALCVLACVCVCAHFEVKRSHAKS